MVGLWPTSLGASFVLRQLKIHLIKKDIFQKPKNDHILPDASHMFAGSGENWHSHPGIAGVIAP